MSVEVAHRVAKDVVGHACGNSGAPSGGGGGGPMAVQNRHLGASRDAVGSCSGIWSGGDGICLLARTTRLEQFAHIGWEENLPHSLDLERDSKVPQM